MLIYEQQDYKGQKYRGLMYIVNSVAKRIKILNKSIGGRNIKFGIEICCKHSYNLCRNIVCKSSVINMATL